VPPKGIQDPPLPQSSNPLRSLAPTGLQREVNQLAWQFCLDSVSSQGKVNPQSGPVPLGGKGV
jgi:hypothetical protein